jgi:hypothetical protein
MPVSLADFPNLRTHYYQVTSPRTPVYNCIAWAAGDSKKRWWPAPAHGYWWPPGIALSDSVASFIAAFETIGYVPCGLEAVEFGFTKVVLYATNGSVKHAARQLPNGLWWSKMGAEEDLVHVLGAVAGPSYGFPVQFLRRPIPEAVPPLDAGSPQPVA